VFSNLTVAENLRMAEVSRDRSNLIGRNIEEPAETVDVDVIYEAFPRLDERREQLAGTLSGGEQQMLAIARALRQGPALLMLDEPYEGLAPQIVNDVEDAIGRINDEGTTILLIEQNAIAAMAISDRCYVIDQGEVVFEGPSAVLPRHLPSTASGARRVNRRWRSGRIGSRSGRLAPLPHAAHLARRA